MPNRTPPYLHALAAGGVLFLLYVLTLAPTTWFWDTSEYIATAHILGLPHPPGNPLFVVVGKVWSLLLAPLGLSVAIRLNLFAAATSAAATGFFYLVAHRVLQGWIEGLREEGREVGMGSRLPLVGAWAGALLAGTAFTVWNQSNVNEKVYTVSVLVIAAVSWLTLLWVDRKEEPGSGRYLVLALYLMVLGSTNHLMSMLPAPALLLVVLRESPRSLLDLRLLSRGALAVLLALSFNFFLPIRSELQPRINEGEPICTSLGSAAVAVYSLGRTGCRELAANLTREQYGKPSVFQDPTSNPFSPEARGAGLLTHQFLNFFQYFDWQWARGVAVSEVPGNARLPFSLLFLTLGFWGLLVARWSHRSHLLYLGVLTATMTLGLVSYLNFKYGYSLAPASVDRLLREVRERDYFFIGAFHLWGFLAGMGLVAAWRWTAGGESAERRGSRGYALASPILGLALVPLILNWGWASRSGDHSARDWAYNLLQSVEPYGILFTNGDNDTFPLWYLQEVEGVRQDVTVIVGQYLYTQWYPRQLRLHSEPGNQRLFREEEGAGVYLPVPAPTRAITTLSDAELAGIGSVTLSQEVTVSLGSVLALQYPAGFQLTRGDQIALAIIQDSIDERPIHFASTGGLARDLGLEGETVRHGLTLRLRRARLGEEEGLVRLSELLGSELLDFDRTLVLAEEVFQYRGLEERAIWTDRSTLNIPWHFYYLYLQLAEASIQLELGEEIENRLLDRADRFALTARGGSRALQ